MNKIQFSKFSGAGNDFILIDSELNPDFNLENSVIRKICDRRNGIGGDGILFIKKSDNYDYELEYYNSDGSLGTLCGNGSRCSIKYAYSAKKCIGNITNFLCRGVAYKGEVFEDGMVKFFLAPPELLKLNYNIYANNQSINISSVDTGSLHAVIRVEEILSNPDDKNSFYTEIDELPVYKIGKEIRFLKDFEKGINVNFIQIKNDVIYIRTFERGVEDETFACGTGSTAAALISSLLYNLKSPVKVITLSGQTLTVEFEYKENSFNNVALIGPAKEVFTGYIHL
ncbi:MAG: diaminopimelate epimerase [bacterium]